MTNKKIKEEFEEYWQMFFVDGTEVSICVTQKGLWSFIEHALDEARKEEREKIKRELIKTKIIDTGLDKVIENMGGAPLGNRSTK